MDAVHCQNELSIESDDTLQLLHCVPQPTVSRSSIRLDILVYPFYKRVGSEEADATCNEADADAEHQRVAKIESCLKNTGHLCLREEVVHSVNIDVKCS